MGSSGDFEQRFAVYRRQKQIRDDDIGGKVHDRLKSFARGFHIIREPFEAPIENEASHAVQNALVAVDEKNRGFGLSHR